MSRIKRVAKVTKGCVACGACVKSCPISAISVYKGIHAVIESTKCVGCGKCATACPAGVIKILDRGLRIDEKEMV